jgi:hypothetical protein
MKKLVIVLLCNLFTICSFGQEFMGIKVDGNVKDVISSFINKGFKITNLGVPDVTLMQGDYNRTHFEVYIVSTPITKTVWKFGVYLPKKTNWNLLKSQYLEYRSSLIEKYGLPEESYSSFVSPYEEGDGFEITGVKVDKCNYSTFWNYVSISIAATMQVRITYENLENSELNKEEKNSVNQSIL